MKSAFQSIFSLHCQVRVRHRSQEAARQVSHQRARFSTVPNEKERLAVVRLYRVLHKSCRSLTGTRMEENRILVQPLLQASDWGRYTLFEPTLSTDVSILLRFFYVLNDTEDDLAIDNCQIHEAVRIAFKRTPENSANARRWAIKATQIIAGQSTLLKNTSIAETEGIRIVATSRCIGLTTPTAVSALSPNNPIEQKVRFAYRIRVENNSNGPVQLLGRYWVIEELDDTGAVDKLKGPVVVDSPTTGAVGQLPVLEPGQVFEYTSGTDITNAKGVMRGHFYMARVPRKTNAARAGDHVDAMKDGDRFEAAVQEFPLEASFESFELE